MAKLTTAKAMGVAAEADRCPLVVRPLNGMATRAPQLIGLPPSAMMVTPGDIASSVNSAPSSVAIHAALFVLMTKGAEVTGAMPPCPAGIDGRPILHHHLATHNGGACSGGNCSEAVGGVHLGGGARSCFGGSFRLNVRSISAA
jgi:hypothetical protein